MAKGLIKRVIVELGMKPYTSYDQETVERVSSNAFKFWETIIASAPQTDVLLWVGDGDEVFNWRGDLSEEISYNKAVGFCNRQYQAYPDSKHLRTYGPDDYTDAPPVLTYADLKRVIECLRRKAREVFGREIKVGTIIDAGPEFVESDFKFERHPEIIEGGPNSHLPQSCAFINCYARMKADDYAYAEFPDGVPEGTTFGEFLGRQLRSMCEAVGFDYCWFSNGLGFTHYAWSYLGEVFDGREWHPEAAPGIVEKFSAFWREFRSHCPDMPIEVRGTNFMVGSDTAAHGIDVRRVYADGKVGLPAPNPPWGSVHMDIEMASHMSRVAWTPRDRILFRFYMNDSWFLSRPWWDYYQREPYDIYCPMSVGRVESDGSVQAATDLALMTVNSGTGGLGDVEQTQALEIAPHFRRAFDYAPDAPGPLVWVYPFDEYQDMAVAGDERLPHVFFHDWFVARCLAGGTPLNTVINTGAFCDLMRDDPAALRQSVLLAPAGIGPSRHVGPLLDFVRSGGKAVVYGSLEHAPQEVLDALNLTLDQPIDGSLAVVSTLPEDTLRQPPGDRPLIHRSRISGGGIREVVADNAKTDTRVHVSVAADGVERAYCVTRCDPSWRGGMISWVRGSLPFEATPISREPVYDRPDEAHDAGRWMRGMLEEMGIAIRQNRHDVSTPIMYTFVHRHEGAFVFSGYKPDASVSATLCMPWGAPVLDGRETLCSDGRTEYLLSKSFSHSCRVFVDQKAESVLKYEELRVRRGEHKHLRVHGLVDATVTLFPQPAFAREGGVKLRCVRPYSITDPSVQRDISRPGRMPDAPEEDVPYTVDRDAGAIVARNVSGVLEVLW